MFRFYLMTINHVSPGGLIENDHRMYDAELDNIISLLHDAGEALAQSDRVRFWVEGFGQTPWPVDVRRDLSVFAEQLPGLVHWIQTGFPQAFELAFYEQGIQRTLTFHEVDGFVSVTCMSWGNWDPTSTEEHVSKEDLVHMVQDFTRVFVEQVTAVCPDIVVHPWFREWSFSVQVSYLA